MKSNSNDRPAIIQNLGNGAYYYNFNITQKTETDEDGNERTTYDYDTVKVWGNPTQAALVKAVIREDLDETAEFELVNEYNAANIGLLVDAEAEAAKERYSAYLRRVQEIKVNVKADLAAAGYTN
jgi:hypothetical protein